MKFANFRAFCLASAATLAFSTAAHAQAFTTPNIATTAGSTSVTLNGNTFTNQGLVGVGRIAAGTKDFLGDTFGAFSGMDLNLAAWRRNADGTYSGGLYSLPDRGPNGIGNVTFSDYAGRVGIYNINFSPYTGTANLPAAVTSNNQLTFTANGGIVLRDFNGNVTTGFDPGTGAASVITQNGIQLPGQTSGTAAGKISIDAEAVRFMRDKSFYVSDEYGANVYYFNATGQLQGVIRPPNALLPRDAAGNLSYSSLVDPVTGRRPNQGLEGMAITPDGKKLVTLLQSATMQDSTSSQQTRSATRLMIYDISNSRTPTNPTAEYVMQLPTYTLAGNGAAVNRTAAQSELLALNDTQFLVLARDGLGLGQATGNPVFKSVMLIDTASATNIAGTTSETAANGTVTPAGGALSSSIRPVAQVEVVNMLNTTQLAKFGMNTNNVTPNRLTITEKWEGMALAPVLDAAAPQDFFLFVGNDNDFLTSNCLVNGQNCSQSVDSDGVVMTYRLTLPTYVDPEYLAAMNEGGPLVVEGLDKSGISVASATIENIADHMSALNRAGWNADGFNGWVSGVYRNEDYDKFTRNAMDAGKDGFRGTIGFDYGMSNAVSVGLAVGYGESDYDIGSGYGVKTDGYNYGATIRLTQGNLFAAGGYTESDLNAKTTRPGAYGLTALGDVDGHGNAAFVDLGFKIPMDGFTISPLVGYRYAEANFDAYVETGAVGGNIAVPKHTFTSSVAKIGAEATLGWGEITPIIHAAYNKELADEPRSITLKLNSATAAMASQTYTINATKEDFVSTGVGLQGDFGGALWHVGYTAEIGMDDRFSHVVNAGIAYRF